MYCWRAWEPTGARGRRPPFRPAAARPADQRAREILAAVAARASDTVIVDLGARSYPVRIGTGILDVLGWEVRQQLPATQAVVLPHPRLRRRFGGRVAGVLRAAGLAPAVVTVPEGERAKSLRTASAVYDQMAAAGVDRRAVGGR